ncbi:hypothetical protein GCM10028796_23570 [Ramlibacter monticola]|uniref:Uncharacterized protein n=1 Tax=Ramlibacter monticola TaxID=1926872 RepID=A0A936Z014_9BURK|nr:hypothetical protein [Ramlibacter monticola]MBL0392603.1 hypothetical protein [Ramlibacter monticola]
MKRPNAFLFVAAGLVAGLAFAQQPQGMVKVDLGTVANTVAKNMNVEAEKIPASVQLPVGIAATTCGVPAAKLAPGAGGEMASCQATTTSVVLEEFLGKQLKAAPKQ